MQIQFRASVTRQSRRRRLSCGGAAAAILAGGALVGVPAQAFAQDACGPLTNGEVVCTPDPDAYPDGIQYVVDPATPLDLTVRLEPGTEIRSGVQGIYVANLNGSVSIDGAGTSIRNRGEAASGVTAVSNNGGVTVVLDSVDIEGHAASGISTSARGGDINITVGSVETVGDFSGGISAVNVDHAINIEAGSVITTGELSTAIFAQTETGDINIRAGLVDAFGALSHGIDTFTIDGDTVIEVDRVITNGVGASGVLSASINGDIDITVGQVTTSGPESFGVFVESESGSVRVRAGEISTSGVDSAGLVAYSILGDAAVEVDSVVTRRDFATGVFVGGGQGAQARVGDVLTSGSGATGIQMSTGFLAEGFPPLFGDAVLVANSVETRGFGAVGISVTSFGDLYLDVASVRTLGDLSDGVTSFSRAGDSRIRVGEVSTAGEAAMAVAVGAEDGNVDAVIGSITTEGALSHGLYGFVRRGELRLVAADGISTSGTNAHGILATVLNGHGEIINAGTIRTTGDASAGIEASARGSLTVESDRIETTGDRSRGMFLSATELDVRPVSVKANVIHTSGLESHGIFIRNTNDLVTIQDGAETGDLGIDIVVGEIVTKGVDAHAIQVQGQGDVSITAGNLRSEQAVAVNVITQGAISLNLTGELSGGQGAARLSGDSVFVDVAAGARIRGAADGLIVKAGSGGGPIGPFADAESGEAVVVNAGEIIAENGSAILVESGRIDLLNTGRISGAVTFSNGDDRFENGGEWVFDRDSEFGFGEDELVNSGVIRMGDGDGAALNLNFFTLERLVNDGGLIDLRNGFAGDSLTTTGDYVGQAGALLALDFSPTASDSFIVQGVATGQTGIVLKGVDARSATLDLAADRALVTMGEGSAPDAFVMATPEIGFVHYDLAYDDETRSYALVSQAGAATHRALRLGEIAQDAWRGSGDAWSAERAASRTLRRMPEPGDRVSPLPALQASPLPRHSSWSAERAATRTLGRMPEPGEVWAQAYGGRHEAEGSVALGGTSADLGYEADAYGAQTGVGLINRTAMGGQVGVGLMVGYSDTEAEFAAVGQTASVRSFNVGVAGEFVRGPWFSGALFKFDSHDIEVDDPVAGYRADLNGQSLGLRVDAGARFGTGVVFEPSVSVDYAVTSLDDLAALDQSVAFEDLDQFQLGMGGRVYGSRSVAGGHRLTLGAGLRAVHALGGDQSVELRSGAATDRVTLDGERTWGEADVGLVWATPSGLSLHATGTGAFGDGRTGGGLRIGARFAF